MQHKQASTPPERNVHAHVGKAPGPNNGKPLFITWEHTHARCLTHKNFVGLMSPKLTSQSYVKCSCGILHGRWQHTRGVQYKCARLLGQLQVCSGSVQTLYESACACTQCDARHTARSPRIYAFVTPVNPGITERKMDHSEIWQHDCLNACLNARGAHFCCLLRHLMGKHSDLGGTIQFVTSSLDHCPCSLAVIAAEMDTG